MSDDTTTTTGGTPDMGELGDVTYEYTYDAPRELVYACLTSAEHLTHFWGPTGMHTPLDKIVLEPWPGGRFNTTMVNDETGEEYPMEGEFIELVEPERIVFKETGFIGLVTTITFRDLGDGRTFVTTHQANIPAMFRTEEAQAGMRTSFDKMNAYVKTLA